MKQNPAINEHGFTLLELLIVLFILGMIAALAWPAAGILDDMERGRLTREKMEIIRRAILGDPDRFDENGIRIIGGYTGDMEKWPDLWEADPDQRPDNVPPYPDPPWTFGYRPAGHFEGKNWKWDYPFRKLLDYADHRDHIGGLETENEGQPKGLWTDNPKGDGTELEDPDQWKGPYLVPPVDEKPSDSQHMAETDDEYAGLEPSWNPALVKETWEDGDYNAPLGEHFDEKEDFRLIQTDTRLTDGWNRALRFFITADPDRPGSTILWIISEGPDRDGTYPAKGTYAANVWTVDPNDIMSKAYDETDDFNKDNIVMKIYSHEWEAVFDKLNEKKKNKTEEFIFMIKKAVIGASPGRENNGFTGDVCRWTKLFRWEVAEWDDEDSVPVSYTKGQPRELWTRTPNASAPGDDVNEPAWAHAGIGWRNEYLQTPWGINGEQYIRDGWDREVLFFKDNAANDAILILSRGVDGKFDFYDTDTLPEGAPDGTDDYLEPESFTEVIDVTTYDPNDAGGYNADNIVLIVRKSDWHPGFFTLNQFIVTNAVANTTKACLFYDNAGSDIRTANGGNPGDGTLVGGVWTVGAAPPPPQAFNYTDITANKIKTGARRLVFWNDADADNIIDTGENQYTAIFNIITSAGSNQVNTLSLDANVDFSAAP